MAQSRGSILELVKTKHIGEYPQAAGRNLDGLLTTVCNRPGKGIIGCRAAPASFQHPVGRSRILMTEDACVVEFLAQFHDIRWVLEN